MSRKKQRTRPSGARGITLIEVVVGVSIMTIVFLGIFGAFKLSIDLVFSTKTKIGAVALMNERIEFIRSLPYSSVGTVAGIPAGPIAQLEQVSLNGTNYTLRTLVQFIDAPEDGLDQADENNTPVDYKLVKVEVLWSVRDVPRSTSAVTYVSPIGLETLASGGTLRVNVFDALTQSVPQASVRIVNSSVTPNVDVTSSANESGVVSFPGSPQGSGYEITVTKSGYSTAQTYSVTTQNPNPSPTHVSVLDGDTTSISFAIDRFGSLNLATFEPIGPGSFTDTFNSSSGLVTTSSTDVVGGAVVLSGGGPYASSGMASSQFIAPNFLVSWNQLVFNTTTSPNTSATVQVLYFNGTDYVLIPDTDLPNNSLGFSEGTINLSFLSVTTYSSLQLVATLTTLDTAETPALLDWSVSYSAGPTPLPGVAVTVFGNKTVGTTAGGLPIRKFLNLLTTDSLGQASQPSLEWDTYNLTIDTGVYDLVELCPGVLSVLPGASLNASLILGTPSAHSLRVSVSANGAPISNAGVAIDSGVVTGNNPTSACGQSFFGNVPIGSPYTVTVTKSGFQTQVEQVTVSGDTTLSVNLVGI